MNNKHSITMVVDTQIEIFNQNDKFIGRFMTRTFTEGTKKNNVDDYISRKSQKSKSQFDVYILDPHGEYVTLDNDYLKDFNPFGAEIMRSTTLQSTTTLNPLIKLRVTLKNTQNHNFQLNPAQQHGLVLKNTYPIDIQHYNQTQRINHAVSTLSQSNCPNIRLSKDPKMGFVKDYNVNYEQRDQYISDYTNVRKKATTGKPAMTQGQKGETNKYKSVLPRFRIWHDGIKDRTDHVWTLLVYSVRDVYQSGKRSLYYHEGRTFVKKDDVGHQSNSYEIPITTNNWMDGMGMELGLPVVAIEGAKTHPNAPRNLLCHVKDIDTSELSDSSDNYNKSRWALVIRKGDDIQWETLVLSNVMIYIRKNVTSSVNNILDNPTNTVSTPSTRRRSKKRQTTSNQQSERRKIPREEDHSSTINSSTNNDIFSLLQNPILLTHYSDSEVRAITPQTMSNIPALSSEVVLNSTGPESLYTDSTRTANSHDDSDEILTILEGLIENENLIGDSTVMGNSMNITNILPTDFEFSPMMSMNNTVLIPGDPLLNAAAFFNADSPNS